MKNYFAYEVTTTQRCDMACSYCFEGEELQNKNIQRSTGSIIQSVYDLLNDETFMSRYQGITINFWGGEPTQNPKMIIQLFNEFKNYPVDFFMYTNGFNKNNLEKIFNNFKLFIKDPTRLTYQISYDGIIHDKERVDHKGNGTSKLILKNIKYFKDTYPEFHFSLKSTLPVDELINLVAIWEDFKLLIDEYPSFSYSPTLEYTNKYLITEEQLTLITKTFQIIAKKEIEYFQKNNRFVWSWFGTGERNVCTAGANIANVDIDGNILVCHGAIYSENKSDFILGHITDHIPEVLNAAHDHHMNILKVPDHCKGCSATVCYQCPIVNHDYSDKESYDEKYHDPKDDLCGIYKSFGTIDRTVQKYLKI